MKIELRLSFFYDQPIPLLNFVWENDIIVLWTKGTCKRITWRRLINLLENRVYRRIESDYIEAANYTTIRTMEITIPVEEKEIAKLLRGYLDYGIS